MQEVTARKGEKGNFFLVEIRPQMDGQMSIRAGGFRPNMGCGKFH